MKPKMKSALVLIVTLLIGVAIGALAWSTLHNQRIKKLRDTRNERQGFYSMVESKLAPLAEDQEPEVRRIVEEYRTQFGEMYRDGRRKYAALMDSMAADLDPVLTEDQATRLREWLERSRNGSRDRNHSEKDKKSDRRNGGH